MKGVSVILTTYNGVTRGYLQQAIESVLNQSYRFMELIIVDDGSSDSTSQFCKEYLFDKRVSYHNQENQGPAAARNRGIKYARYRYITFLDDDDFYERDMVEKMYREITHHHDPKIGMVYCRTRHIDTRGTLLKTPLFLGKMAIYEALFYGNIFSTPAVIIDKSLFDSVGQFREHLAYAEDYDLWFRIASSFGVYPLDEILTNIRVHDHQLSQHPRIMELYHSLVLHQAIKEASLPLSSFSDSFYYLFYVSYMKIYLGMSYFTDFRRMLLLAKSHGPITLKWRMKYWLSYFPKLFVTLKKVVNG